MEAFSRIKYLNPVSNFVDPKTAHFANSVNIIFLAYDRSDSGC